MTSSSSVSISSADKTVVSSTSTINASSAAATTAAATTALASSMVTMDSCTTGVYCACVVGLPSQDQARPRFMRLASDTAVPVAYHLGLPSQDQRAAAFSAKSPAAKEKCNESLMQAIREGRISDVRNKMFETTCDHNPNYCDKMGDTPLMVAIGTGSPEIVRLLLQRGAKPNCDKKGNTPLMMAVSADLSGNVKSEIVKLLLNAQADPNAQSRSKATALILAAKNGDTVCTKLLLKKGANPDLQMNMGLTALMVAARAQNPEIIPLLLKYKATPDIQDERGRTAIMYAVEQADATSTNTKRLAIIKMLLASGADRYLKDKDGKTASELAIDKKVGQWVNDGFPENLGSIHESLQEEMQTNRGDAKDNAKKAVVQTLTQSSSAMSASTTTAAATSEAITMLTQAELNQYNEIVSESGKTKFMHMLIDVNTVCTLINRGVDINAQGKGNRTPLMEAIENGYIASARALLKAGANINVASARGETALKIATRKEYMESVIEWLGKSPKMLATMEKEEIIPPLNDIGMNYTVFMRAIKSNDIDYVRNTLSSPLCPLDNDAMDIEGKTPLMIAAEADSSEIVELLLKDYADPDIQSLSGETPLIIAAQKKHLRSMMVLLRGKANTDIQTKSGHTALMLAASKGFKHVVELLLTLAASRTIKNNDGKTASMIAQEEGHHLIAELINNWGEKSRPITGKVKADEPFSVPKNSIAGKLLVSTGSASTDASSIVASSISSASTMISAKMLVEESDYTGKILVSDSLAASSTSTTSATSTTITAKMLVPGEVKAAPDTSTTSTTITAKMLVPEEVKVAAPDTFNKQKVESQSSQPASPLTMNPTIPTRVSEEALNMERARIIERLTQIDKELANWQGKKQ